MQVQPVIQVYQPCLALQDFVSSYTIAYLNFNQPIVRINAAYAQQYLIFNLTNQRQFSIDGENYGLLPENYIIGPFTLPTRMTINPQELTVLVNLKPGALHRLTHLPLQKILNKPLDAVDGFGNEIRRLNEQLSEVTSQKQIIGLIEAFLLKKIQEVKESLPVDHVFNLIAASPGQYTMDKLADLSCVSFRQLERLFLNRIGVTPSMFIRQLRLAKASRLKRIDPKLTWTAVAYECGYFDQMHLIRDFKFFTGATPNTFKIIIPEPIATK
jgi:AraC-like DNA-binding protein